jgi:hypothetical protein
MAKSLTRRAQRCCEFNDAWRSQGNLIAFDLADFRKLITLICEIRENLREIKDPLNSIHLRDQRDLRAKKPRKFSLICEICEICEIMTMDSSPVLQA